MNNIIDFQYHRYKQVRFYALSERWLHPWSLLPRLPLFLKICVSLFLKLCAPLFIYKIKYTNCDIHDCALTYNYTHEKWPLSNLQVGENNFDLNLNSMLALKQLAKSKWPLSNFHDRENNFQLNLRFHACSWTIGPFTSWKAAN